MPLILHPNISDPDRLYEKIIALHEGQTSDVAIGTAAKLILLLVNHIGDVEVIEEAIAHASKDTGPER